VHGPVADNALLVRAGEHLTRMVCSAERWERFVWNVSRQPRLNAHPALADHAPWPAAAFADTASPLAWWRTERQTFIPLPDVMQAVFTIGIDTQPLADGIDTPDKAAKLHAAIASMSDAVLAYRNLASVRTPLLAWLASRM
jgi:dimethylamine monooxygenase subunit A